MPENSLLERKLAELDASRYLKRLGVSVVRAGEDGAEISLPYKRANANRGGNVHGGVIASALVVSSSLAACAARSRPGPAEGRPLGVTISFLRAASGESLMARAASLHGGRDIVHVASDVHSAGGTHVATALLTYGISRISEADDSSESCAGGCLDTGELERLASADAVRMSGSPYGLATGAAVVSEKDARACVRLPVRANEGAAGHVHEAAITGLVDNCGAYASYSSPGASYSDRGSTVAMHVSYLPPVAGDLLAVGRLLGRSGSSFTNQVEVWSPSQSRLAAVAAVTYRIVGEVADGT